MDEDTIPWRTTARMWAVALVVASLARAATVAVLDPLDWSEWVTFPIRLLVFASVAVALLVWQEDRYLDAQDEAT